MCVGLWSLDSPDYALILCTNRDEYLSRPTLDAHFHSFARDFEAGVNDGNILSGLDTRAGGTWLGMSRTGRLALLTNITEPPSAWSSSRGHLVSSFLLSDSSHPLEDEVGKITRKDARYAGFNLLLLAPSSRDNNFLSFDASFVSNGGAGGIITSRSLSDDERRFGGMSNGIDGRGADEWPKVQRGIQSLKSMLEAHVSPDTSEAGLVEHLFELLTWRSSEPVQGRMQLKNTIEVVPITLPSGTTPQWYGTRLSTVILVRQDGQVLFIERDMWKLDVDANVIKADTRSERVFRFNIAAPFSQAN